MRFWKNKSSKVSDSPRLPRKHRLGPLLSPRPRTRLHVVVEFSALGVFLFLIRLICRLHMSNSDATVPPDLVFLALHESLRTFRGDDLFVAEYKQRGVAGEVAVQIFECATCGLGVEEVDCGCQWGGLWERRAQEGCK